MSENDENDEIDDNTSFRPSTSDLQQTESENTQTSTTSENTQTIHTQTSNLSQIQQPTQPSFLKFMDINLRQLMKTVKKDNKRKLEKQRIQISFKKSVLKKVSKNKKLHLNQHEMCIIINYITQFNNPIWLLPEGGRSSLQSLKLLLRTLHSRMTTGDEKRSLPDLLFLVSKDISQAKFDEFKKSQDYKNYEKVRDFDCYQYLDDLTNGVKDDDDDDENDQMITHSQNEINNEENDDHVHNQYQGITYKINNIPDSTSYHDADSLLQLINSQDSMQIDEIDEKEIEKENFNNFINALRNEFNQFKAHKGDKLIKKANILTALVSNLILFDFDVKQPYQNPILNYVLYFLNLKDEYQALKWIGNAKTSITEKLLVSKVIDSNDKIINLKKYQVMLAGRVIPSYLINKYSTYSGSIRRRSNVSPSLSPQSHKPPKKKQKSTHGFQFPLFKSPLSSNPNTSNTSILPQISLSPNPSKPSPSIPSKSSTAKSVTFQDLQKFKNDINNTIQQSHYSLKKKMDKENYSKKPTFAFDPNQSNIQQLVTVNANNISALAVDKPKKLDAMVTMVDLSRQKTQSADMKQITKLLNSRIDDDGKKISNKDIVRELEGCLTIQKLLEINSSSNSSRIQSEINERNVFTTKVQVILFLCGYFDEFFTIFDLYYKMVKFLRPDTKYIDKFNRSTELSSLFKNKWNSINLFTAMREFLYSITSKLNKKLPKSEYEMEIYQIVRCFCDYKSFDLSKANEVLIPFCRDDSFVSPLYYTWLNTGIKSALTNNKSYYCTFASNWMQNKINRTDKMTLNSFLSSNFYRFDPDSIPIKAPKKAKDTAKPLKYKKETENNYYDRNKNKKRYYTSFNNNNNYKYQSPPNHNFNYPSNYHQQYRTSYNSAPNYSPVSNLQRHFESSNNKPINPMTQAFHKIKILLKNTGTTYQLSNPQCALFNGEGDCKKGDDCPRDHECILCPQKNHPLCKCGLAFKCQYNK